jgi:hypothetical protein
VFYGLPHGKEIRPAVLARVLGSVKVSARTVPNFDEMFA